MLENVGTTSKTSNQFGQENHPIDRKQKPRIFVYEYFEDRKIKLNWVKELFKIYKNENEFSDSEVYY